MISIFYVIWVLFASSCLEPALKYTSESTAVLVASTPGNSLIKSLLAIPQERKVDFIRWGLTLNEGSTGAKSFVLNITFGEAQPNTLGFTGGGKKQTFKGTYTLNYTLSRRNIVQGKWAVKKGDGGNPQAVIYQLDSHKANTSVSFLAGDENVLFFLDKNKNLLAQDNSFSFTLNKKD